MCGCYHGNFSLENTLYCLDEFSGDVTVKLTNFKKDESKTKVLNILHKEDWHSVGHGLKHVSAIAKERNGKESREIFDCCQIDDLAKMLLDLGPGDLEITYQKVKDDVFFWEKQERKKFFVYRIPLALKDKNFTSKVEACDNLCCLPWDQGNQFAALVGLMDQHRLKNGKDVMLRTARLDLCIASVGCTPTNLSFMWMRTKLYNTVNLVCAGSLTPCCQSPLLINAGFEGKVCGEAVVGAGSGEMM